MTEFVAVGVASFVLLRGLINAYKVSHKTRVHSFVPGMQTGYSNMHSEPDAWLSREHHH